MSLSSNLNSKICIESANRLLLLCLAPLLVSLISPVWAHKSSDPAVESGRLLFIKSTCWSCHPRGDNSLNGDKPLRGSGFQKKYPTDESLMQFIRKGNPDYGMPAFSKETISDKDLKLIVCFIRSLSAGNAK